MKSKKNNWLSRAVALLLPLLLLAGAAFAQTTAANEPEMADALRASGKIYVVVLVLVIIVTGLLVYLIRLDGKVSRLEKSINE
ncbi:MAG TPA: CcmD family protein [Hymenobacter sp.]|uniref:CcmD family protein n=1 Tax=Hymenobacter sp. TaxID=1898978 RepID=UPI002D7F87B5|nr:CcmD family protein [Hymenobacter sp.]HET9506036.1 CcmD family protein [Hymenobacter sp.]